MDILKSLQIRISPDGDIQNYLTTYRLRMVPRDWDSDKLQDFLDKTGHNVSVKSLALEVKGDYKTATCTFDGPRPHTTPKLKSLSIDQDFYGLTTLYAPSPEDHEIE